MTEQSPEAKNEIITADNEIEEKMNEIEKMSNEYALHGEYDKAKECKKQIVVLQAKLKERKKQDLEQQHICEMENLEQAYQAEIEKFNSTWSEKFQDLEDRSQKAEDAINERQLKEMEDLYATIGDKLPRKVKYSKEYLLLDHQEKMLVKLQKFDEAKVIRKRKEQQKKVDEEKWDKEKNEKIKAQAIQKSKKHIAEKNVLKKKFETEIDIMKKEKEKEIAQIEKKYQAKKIELELQQKSEANINLNEKMLKKRQIGLNIYTYPPDNNKHARINTHSNMVQPNEQILYDDDSNHKEVNLEDSDTTESKKASKDDLMPQKQIQNGEIVNKYII